MWIQEWMRDLEYVWAVVIILSMDERIVKVKSKKSKIVKVKVEHKFGSFGDRPRKKKDATKKTHTWENTNEP